MKVALIHDHLAQDGGAEKVLQVFAGMFKEAPIYTLLYDKHKQDQYYQDRQIEVSVIQKLPGGVRHYQWYLPLMPLAVEFYDLSPYDLVLSDTSSFAKGVITKPETLHICYCHTPTRFLWSDAHQYLNELKYNKWLKKIISLALSRIRLWDRLAADRVDLFIANSKTVQARIKKYYRRESVVIYPPVETDKFEISYQADRAASEKYFLAGCRLAPYKRIDLIIEAFKELGPDYRLRIFGDGVDLKRLKKLARGRENIEFLGRVTEEEKIKLFAQAEAFINPQEEDFGITVVESMAAGRPVIALAAGGALETVVAGKTGLFFTKQTAASLAEAIRGFKASDFDPVEIRAWAEKFSVANFTQQIRDFINKHYSQPPSRLT
ncbi:MAG: glycosyltransferase [Patescibacteria group bacterium]|jgi:glycosyltransferase involved in cell wall biosynthesis